MPRYPLPSFSYQGETKDLQVESLYQGEIKELGEKGDEKGRVGQGKWLWAALHEKRSGQAAVILNSHFAW